MSSYQLSDLAPIAFDIAAKHGLHALTLRPLAERTGMTLAALTHLVGKKQQLLALLILHARQVDTAFRAAFLATIQDRRPLSVPEFAEFCDWFLDCQARENVAISLFFCEALLAAPNDPGLAADLAPWLDDHRHFWRSACSRADVGDAMLLAEALAGFHVDEMAHGAALNGVNAYARLRRLSLARLCAGDLADPAKHSHDTLFTRLFSDLGQLEDPIRIDRGDGPDWDTRTQRYAAAAAHTMVHTGLEGLTHRAVAEVAGVASSTLAYHFRTRDDLVKGAMTFLILRIQKAAAGMDVTIPSLPQTNISYEIARSTFMLALEASRNTAFLASAADMRRKRGINLRHAVNARLPAGRFVDGLGAQALSLVSNGTTLLNSPGGIVAAKTAADAILYRLVPSGESGEAP